MDNQIHTPPTDPSPESQEPTVLDLYKSVTRDRASFINFIRSLWDARRREELDRALANEVAQQYIQEPAPEEPARVSYFPWRSIVALVLALGGQVLLEPQNRQVNIAIALYVLAAGICIWAYLKNEWHLPALPVAWQTSDDLSTRLVPFLLSIGFAAAAFWSFGEGVFTFTNTLLWLLAIAALFYGLWIKVPKVEQDNSPEARRNRILWSVLVICLFAITLFFRLYRTTSVPAEPFSDHAEKILDVYDITQGQYKVFFPRNTGREAFQMYWTLLVAKVFGTGLTFISLKLGTALIGILTIPYVYLLGREYGGKRVGLFALFLFGIAYWPNVISRIGLRFPLYPLFVAPTLFYLLRGLRTHNRNDFLLSGFFLGMGLHGYSPFRMAPILVVVAFGIYALHLRSRENHKQALWWLVIVIVTSLFIFIPLFRYVLSNPEIFGYRAMTRLTSAETALPGPAWQIFLSNLWKGMLMFNWDNGGIWVHSVPGRPALDVVSAALFAIGFILLIARYIRQRDWRDIFLLISIPILLMPSVLSLAFPDENPSLNRTGGAAVVVFVICALALDGFVSSLGAEKKRVIFAYALTGLLFAASAYQNYDLVFHQFDVEFRNGAWNTSEMGKLISEFRDKYGETDTVWIVPFPYWVDTRLPGVWAGIPNRDFALWPEGFAATVNIPGPKLIIYKLEDVETEKALKVLYPNGDFSRYTSSYADKDFMVLRIGQ
ncbi:MAG: glycosyltransferase family 39 protein [Chloroflexi bacterium]|nr:glycosyltransferase family 39 protein [Chloroflexota bacterium]